MKKVRNLFTLAVVFILAFSMFSGTLAYAYDEGSSKPSRYDIYFGGASDDWSDFSGVVRQIPLNFTKSAGAGTFCFELTLDTFGYAGTFNFDIKLPGTNNYTSLGSMHINSGGEKTIKFIWNLPYDVKAGSGTLKVTDVFSFQGASVHVALLAWSK